MKSIIVSREDIGGMNIRSRLIENFDFRETDRTYKGNKFWESKKAGMELLLLDTLHIFSEHLDKLNSEFIIFCLSPIPQ